MDANDTKLAKRLARMVLDGGEPALSDLRPALERILEGRSSHQRKAFLKAFHKAALLEIRRDTLVVESAQELPEETVQSLATAFQKEGGRPLLLTTRLNPDLIAGIRVRLGDSVFDASLSHHLRALAARVS